MAETYKIKAYSRTTAEDDETKMSQYTYNGSFQASVEYIDAAFNQQNQSVLLSWSNMMDCFYDALFIRVDTDEVVTFNKYQSWRD